MKIEDERKTLKRVTDGLTKLSQVLIEIMDQQDPVWAKYAADVLEDAYKRIERYRDKH